MFKKWHSLFSGELTDAPGRNESWEEEVCYIGNSQWILRSIGTDFTGMYPGQSYSERMGTKKLIRWVIERDYEDGESNGYYPGESEDESELKFNVLGPRAKRLREIAKEVDANLCFNLLDKWKLGVWPKTPSPPRIKDIVDVVARGVWLRVFDIVYVTTTNQGDAFLYPPGINGKCKLVLKTSSSFGGGWHIKPSLRVIKQMDHFEEDFNILKEMKSKGIIKSG